jgi:hypothetical protein
MILAHRKARSLYQMSNLINSLSLSAYISNFYHIFLNQENCVYYEKFNSATSAYSAVYK